MFFPKDEEVVHDHLFEGELFTFDVKDQSIWDNGKISEKVYRDEQVKKYYKTKQNQDGFHPIWWQN